jgi:DNA-binding transcriptional LysR family regulator
VRSYSAVAHARSRSRMPEQGCSRQFATATTLSLRVTTTSAFASRWLVPWERWFEMASATDPRAREGCQIALSFREELHAIEAVLAGHGIALCSDVVVADDLASGALVKVLDLALPRLRVLPSLRG